MNMTTAGKKLYYRTRDGVSPQKNINFNNITVTLPAYFVENFSWTIETERPVIEDLIASINDGDSFYDIGAQAGLYSIVVGRAIEGDITAFEPYPPNVARLKRYLNWNGVDAQVHAYALSDGTTEVICVGRGKIQIDSQSGDNLVESGEIPKPDVVKIDVEGVEFSVIQGLKKSLRQCRLVYCEAHPALLDKRGESVDMIIDFLEEQEFDTEIIVEREKTNTQPIIRAERLGSE
jgi:FkbM family methyltransferase